MSRTKKTGRRGFYGTMALGTVENCRKVAPRQTGWNPERERLHNRIYARIDAMHKLGQTEEARKLEDWLYRVTNCGGLE